MVASAVRLVVHGSGAGEEFAFGFWLAHVATLGGESDLSTFLDSWDSKMGSAETPSTWSDLVGLLSSDQKYDSLSAYYYADTKTPATFLHHKVVNHSGASGRWAPLQQSAVVTLKTARSGASFRGRMYLPATGLDTVSPHVYAGSVVNQIGLAAANMLGDALAAARGGSFGDPTRVAVYSPSKNVVTDVTSVTVDNRADVQRRRAGKQVTSITSFVGPNP